MCPAFQRIRSHRKQQEVSHTEPQEHSIPARSASQPPTAQEQYARSGNQARATQAAEHVAAQEVEAPAEEAGAEELSAFQAAPAQAAQPSAAGKPAEKAPTEMVHGQGSGAQGVASLKNIQVLAPEGSDREPTSEDYLTMEDSFRGAEEACVGVLAGFEEQASRWYLLGWDQEQNAQERPLYQHDLAYYQRYALEARMQGGMVLATLAMAEQAMQQSDATRADLAAAGLATLDGDQLSLDGARVAADIAAAQEGFQRTGLPGGGATAALDMAENPGRLLECLEQQGHGLSFALASLRAKAVAEKATPHAERIEEILDYIETLDSISEVASTAVELAAAGAGGSENGLAEKILDTAGEALPEADTLAGKATAVWFYDEVREHQAHLDAIASQHDGLASLAQDELARQAISGYQQALARIDEERRGQAARREDLIADFAEKGLLMDLQAQSRGELAPGGDRACSALKHLASVRATHLTLQGVLGPLEQRRAELGEASTDLTGFANGRPAVQALIDLRQQQSGAAEQYKHHANYVKQLITQLLARRDELTPMAEAFQEMLSTNA